MMGDMGDAMLDGTACNICGVFLFSDSGIPTNCGCDPSQDYIQAEPSDKELIKRAKAQGWEVSDEGD